MVDQLLVLYAEVPQVLNRGLVDIFLDFSKTFNVVSHSIILKNYKY